MEPHRIYLVATASVRPGKAEAADKWWREKGKAFHESVPGVKSVRTYATQFGLGGAYDIEIWLEIENYAVMDRSAKDIDANPQKYSAIDKEFNELFESGPGRLMGDWPESLFTKTH